MNDVAEAFTPKSLAEDSAHFACHSIHSGLAVLGLKKLKTATICWLILASALSYLLLIPDMAIAADTMPPRQKRSIAGTSTTLGGS